MNQMHDATAYELYPKDKWIYDKRVIAGLEDVACGDVIPDNKRYCVKPCENLEGCSIGSKIVEDMQGWKVPAGFAWFEYLEGTHWTADYIRDDNGWILQNIFIGDKDSTDHKKFLRWFKPKTVDLERYCIYPEWLSAVKEAPVVNIEFIGGKAIEAHLRGNTDPVSYDLLIPMWFNQTPSEISRWKEKGFKYLPETQNHIGRHGFYVK